MSRKHIIEYFKTMENQYLTLVDSVEDLKKAVEEGILSQERVEENMQYIDKLGENYYRLAYIIYLLNLPNNTKSKTKYEYQNKLIRDGLVKHTDKQVISENEEGLSIIKNLLKEAKENNE